MLDTQCFVTSKSLGVNSMSRYESASRVFYRCQYHIVWTPKYRYKILKGKVGKKKLWGNHFWQRGYFVDSVGANEEIIRRYVRHQDKQAKEDEERQLLLDVGV